jgi:hypothetical protein
VVYDRSKYAALANMPIMIKVEGASAVPSIGEFTAEVFKKVMGCTTVEDASQKAKTNVERHSLESASQAMAF